MTSETEKLDAVAKDLAALRAKMAPDSPLQSAAFQLAALVGEIQAELQSRPPAPAPFDPARGAAVPEDQETTQ